MVWGLAVVLAFAAANVMGQVTVSGRVVDDNGVVVSGARVEFRSASSGVQSVTSDKSGSFTLRLEAAGTHHIRAEHAGFFVLEKSDLALHDGANHLVITLNHVQEFSESVDVIYSPPVIDPQEPAERKQLNNVELLTVPYPAPHDLRNALPLLQGVVQDANGRLHFNGGTTDQASYSLEGFNIADPVTGRLEARLNIDTVRSLDLESNRFSVDRGRGSAGSLDIKTKMGDDRWRFGGTNFVPGVSSTGGLHINKWTPRLELSGPLAKGRAWFHNGFELFYDLDTIHGLPSGQNRTRSLSGSNISRFQVNLTPRNILMGNFLANRADAARHGLTFLDPVETTTTRRQAFYMSSLKDQHYFGNGALLELGFADSRGATRELPQGDDPYQISPWGRRGNYYVNFDRHSYRQQWLATVLLPAFHKLGSHQLKAGLDFERESFRQRMDRHDYLVLRTDSSLARHVTFEGNHFQRRNNFEAGHYVLDRWTPRRGILIETGLRLDWDQVVRDVLWSPRFSVAWAPGFLGDAKIAAGYGIFHDALILGTLTRHQDQVSLSTFFPRGSGEQKGPYRTAFLVDEDSLRVPRYQTLTASIERKLPLELYGKAAYTRKVGSRGFTFVNELEAFGAPHDSYYYLRNWRNDRYDALELSLRRTIGKSEWAAGYTRSSSRSDAVVDYSLENPIFARQGPGPFSWDTPHRFLLWGWTPLPKRWFPRFLQSLVQETDVAYLVEYRTGFPFSVVNEEGYLVSAPNSRRFPDYFNINLHFEKRFRFMHYLWAWRFGFNNITNNGNANVVNNNIDSPAFLTYGRGQLRAFSVRLRLLGRR